LENLDVDGRTIVKYILKKYDGGCELDSSGSGKGQVVGLLCEHLGFIKCREFCN